MFLSTPHGGHCEVWEGALSLGWELRLQGDAGNSRVCAELLGQSAQLLWDFLLPGALLSSGISAGSEMGSLVAT